MNKIQKIIALTYAILISASIVFAPHHANGTGDAIFRMLGSKSPIPYSSNASARAKIEEQYARMLQNPKSVFHGMSLDQFSRSMARYVKDNPTPDDLDYTAGLSGWPVPNYTMLAGFWAIVTILSGIGLIVSKDTKKTNRGAVTDL